MTPMLEQYHEIKKIHPNEIVLFRLGDFYEMFGQDAITASPILDIALTARYKNTNHEIPMCGVPHHAVDGYIAKLTLAGLRVAICDQMSDPSLPGIVERAVSRVITPGTALQNEVLSPRESHYLVSLAPGKKIGIAYVDLSTGVFRATEVANMKDAASELHRLTAAEVLFPAEEKNNVLLQEELRKYVVFPFQGNETASFRETLMRHFHLPSLSSLGIEAKEYAQRSAAMIVEYLRQTQKQETLEHIERPRYYEIEEFLVMDEATLKNLEVFKNTADGGKNNTLLSVLDLTITASGARTLRDWILRPLQEVSRIEVRLNAVDWLKQQRETRAQLRTALRGVSDIERILGRMICNRGNARDLILLNASLANIPVLKNLLQNVSPLLLHSIVQGMAMHQEVADLIQRAIIDEPTASLADGGYIKTGFSAELDELRSFSLSGKDWIARMQEEERQRTKISSLKVGFNSVFGYYIEVTKPNIQFVPSEYIRKQTLVNAERYITPALKEYEEKILGAEAKIKHLEWELFQQCIQEIKQHIPSLQNTAKQIACLDVLASFAETAAHNNYHRPKVTSEGRLVIKDGRHPVIEQIQKEYYIPNSLYLDHETQELIILTGPNMSGKSSYIRQNAIIVLLAHIGSFVPALFAEIALTDRIFTRVGASDNLAQGQSTFMVEMEQAAYIIQNATAKSFIVFDELGRGTSTYDGVSIAWAIATYVHSAIGAKTLFATHYHELMGLEEALPRAKNYSVKVKEQENGEILFLHEVARGGVDKSYGIEVARLAGLPPEVISHARLMLQKLNNQQEIHAESKEAQQTLRM